MSLNKVLSGFLGVCVGGGGGKLPRPRFFTPTPSRLEKEGEKVNGRYYKYIQVTVQ